MSQVLERIIEQVRALPPDEQQQLRELLDREHYDKERARRTVLSQEIRSKYARIARTSSDDYAREKAVEVLAEDRRR